ncbi:MAG: alpha/beta hydrolase [Flavobacteriales bacterium]
MEFQLIQKKTYRYQVLNDNPQAKTVLYVLHGYGQLVKFFIQKFKNLNQEILIVAPEGMHRFYKKGNSGRVGASWMTKEARETDIYDNMNYLNALDADLATKYPITKRLLLGFSQGGSTAIRWKLDQKIKFDALIVWASDFPPDKEWPAHMYKESHNIIVIGNNDEFFTEESKKQVVKAYLNKGFEISNYIGTHDIEQNTLKKLFDKL